MTVYEKLSDIPDDEKIGNLDYYAVRTIVVEWFNDHDKGDWLSDERVAFITSMADSAIESLMDSASFENNERLDEVYGVFDISAGTAREFIGECADFSSAQWDSVSRFAAKDVGHDFTMTRNGEGVGFWDGDYPEPYATTLTDASKTYNEFSLYVGDNGTIYGFNG